MGFVQFFLLMLSAHLVLAFPPTERTYTMNGRRCNLCPAGEFQASCTKCAPCPGGSYTSDWNREDSCLRCYGDCSPSFHLKVVQSCSRTSNVKCVCEAGFRCTEKVLYSENCRECVRIPDITTTEAGKDKQTPSPVSSGHSSTSSKPCTFPKCDTKSVPGQNTSKPEKSSVSLEAVLCPVVLLGCLALVALFFIRRSRDNTCFSQTIAKLCNEKGPDASRKSMDSSHQFPRDSVGAKQQPSTLSANLGPVYVHNPGTVIFSSVSQFTGQVGPTVESGKTSKGASREEEEEEEEEKEEEGERNCHVCHPTSPHSVHLSEEEEKSEEADCIFFPSQEQGKDYHMSMEEVL